MIRFLVILSCLFACLVGCALIARGAQRGRKPESFRATRNQQRRDHEHH